LAFTLPWRELAPFWIFRFERFGAPGELKLPDLQLSGLDPVEKLSGLRPAFRQVQFKQELLSVSEGLGQIG